MQMNPKMDVPVLQNDTLIVPSSNQIIGYLEANFVDTHPTLLPTEDRNLLKQIVFLHRKISQIPIGIISLGTILHPKIVKSPQLPFIGPLRASFLSKPFVQVFLFCFLFVKDFDPHLSLIESEGEMLNRLENTAKSDPLHHDTLLMKVKMQREKMQVIQSPDEFHKLIDALGILLIEIEAQLQQQSCKQISL